MGNLNLIAVLANEICKGKLERESAALHAQEMIHDSTTNNGQGVGAHTDVEKIMRDSSQ